MRKLKTTFKAALLATSAIAGCSVAIGTAEAGGFAIREQSAQFQGSSFAGSAAGGGLSSMYWNPAALGQADWGQISESHFSGIFGQAKNTVETYTPSGASPLVTTNPPGLTAGQTYTADQLAPLGFKDDSGDIADPALVSSSYYAYRLSNSLVLGMSLNSGFGLSTKPNNFQYLGAELGQTTKLFTMNATPTLAYKIAPGITVAAGVQVQYARAKLMVASGAPSGPSSVYKDADDVAVGGTAGILIEPTAGTSIGLGYRSQLSHELEGKFSFAGGAMRSRGVTADLDLPDIVTLSLRQAIAPNMRLLGTVEWSNWSRFKKLELKGEAAPVPVEFDTNWSDGWLFALGGEYDYAPGWTLRAGVAYEISPVDDAKKRLTSIPDNDRWWLSLGATVQLMENVSADFAYSHIFVENGDFERVSLAGNDITGHTEAQVDIWSVSLKTKWGGERPLAALK